MAEQDSEAEASHTQEGDLHRPFKRKFNDTDDTIVWPPVVIIENTLTHFDKQINQWKGLENEEIRCFLRGFKDVQFSRVVALYGFHGNRGKAVVIFPATPSGYMDAHTLSELLERAQRGRQHWQRVCHIKDPCGPGKVTPDGKKILYGYLASERDMLDADKARKVVKRWAMERYEEKVLQPLNQCERETEEARKKRVELTEEATKKIRAVEENKEQVDKAAAQFRKINEEIESQKKQEEELEAKHRKSFEERKKQYEQEKLQKLGSFKDRERSIRQHLEQNNIAKQNAVIKFEELARRLKDGIDMERRNHELRSTERQQLEMIDRLKLDSLLQSKMEEKLAALEKKFQDKQLKLQEQHNEQIIKSREKLAVEKEKFLEEKLQELKKIEIESQEAKTITIATQKEIERECIICFIDIVAEKRERAHFEACGHANICSKCAQKLWQEALKKKVKPSCPTCKTEQRKKFSLLPAAIYT
ncbi:hypothetical protein GOP47_0012056 [Adiantum capillus-veneris]|uniref:RING-type domain-containing protein n=1 Tax=Adiantum capillus-veneris TaxID=13818 RepID=A0A9D4UT81_ADICA|nr:hypothetical protein GOP47_0011678 [Adiantum capillus-veneris]KAI5074043.1 hypothetical protein GOP47_0012056 [Adiantum capillus-veneris]